METSIGEKISIFRKRSKLSKTKLAEITGISIATITSYETSKTLPSAENIVKIAVALNVPVNDFLSVSETGSCDEIIRLYDAVKDLK